MPPRAELRKRPQDGISWVQKVAAVELGFRGAPGCLRGIWIYIGGRSRSGGHRGAHKVGGGALPPERALHPCGRLVALMTCTPSLLGVWSKKNHRKSFIPFGIPFLRNSKTRKKQELAVGSRLIG